MENLKKCSICKKLLPLTDFYRDRTRSFGRSNKCKKCWKEKYWSHNNHSVYHSTRLTGTWSKYGGRSYSVVYSQFDMLSLENSPTWICQSCGNELPNSIAPMKYEYPKGDYIRVCSSCFVDNCQALKKRLKEEI